MDSETPTAPPRFTIVAPPTFALPTTYADAAFLHVLATRPEKVVPSGKSLRAALLRPEASPVDASASPSLQTTVEEIVHRAFWDEARESLADPAPARQLARLRLLYTDLHTALEDVLPKSHPSFVMLSDPLSPTPAPLLSARRHLSELTAALQTRCAPIRDTQLSAIRALLGSEDASNLPARIVQAVRDLLRVAEVMKKDLANAVLSAVSDEDLESEVVRAAREEERRTVLELYSVQGVRERWKVWLAGENADDESEAWVRRLVKALGSDVALSCPIPNGLNVSAPSNTDNDNDINTIPPTFLLSAPDLFHLQNHIQALVIAAVLRTLVPLYPNSQSFTASSALPTEEYPEAQEDRTFAERVLALLMIEVDESSEDAGSTKLVNLADEVVREHRRLLERSTSAPMERNKPPALDENTLRSRVDALLQPTSGVFVLLRKRLLSTLSDGIVSALQVHARAQEKGRRVPDAMQTGRERKRLRLDDHSLHLQLTSSSKSEEKGTLRRVVEEIVRTGRAQTKGFEDPVLRRGVGAALDELADVVEWVRDTWAAAGLELEGLDKDADEDADVRRIPKVKDEEA